MTPAVIRGLGRRTVATLTGIILCTALALAAEPASAEWQREMKRLSDRVEKLEKRNQELERSLSDERLSETEPEIATRLKAVEFQALGMQKQARTVEALEGVTAGVGLTVVAQGANAGATTDNTGESQLNYRADVSVSLPAGHIGSAKGKIFGQFRLGQGNGLEMLKPVFSGPNTTAFQLGGVAQPDDSAALLAQAWYQADIPLPRDGAGLPSRERLTLNFGKLDPFVFFDQNAAANDETRQFLNNVFVHNALLDAGGDVGADAYGFSPGVRLAYLNETQKPLAHGLSLGVFGAGSGAKFNNSFSSPFVIVQADTRRKFFGGLDGNYRLYVWRNGQAAPYGNSADAGREAHAGWGASVDQRVGDAVTLFGRYGQQINGRVRFDRALALGTEFGGAYWNRGGDALGVAFGGQRVSGDFRDHSLTLDANSDGTPDYGYPAGGTERVTELYYRYRLHKQFELTPDVQLIQRPGGDGSASGMTLVGARAQLTF